jgi:hypothetical protein
MVSQLYPEGKMTEHGYLREERLPDGRIKFLYRKIYTWAVGIGDDLCPHDHWCYTSELKALKEFERWNPMTEAEPTGWFRNPQSGRRRPDGDPAKEYSAP